jgi:hypothetical protein
VVALARFFRSNSIQRFFLILFLFVSLSLAHAQNLRIECGADGELKSFRYGSSSQSFPQELESALHSNERNTLFTRAYCENLGNCYRAVFRPIAAQTAQKSVFAVAEMLRSAPPERGLEDLSIRRTLRVSPSQLNLFLESLSFCEQPANKFANDRANFGLSLSYPFKGPNRSKQSESYDRRVVETAVRHAVSAGVDPYLVVGILMMESPPLLGVSSSQEYSYGLIPIDALPIYDMLGCAAPRSSAELSAPVPRNILERYRSINGSLYTNREFADWLTNEVPNPELRNRIVGILECRNCPAVLRPQSEIPKINLPGDGSKPIVIQKLCSERSVIDHGVSAQFNGRFGCCVEVAHPSLEMSDLDSHLKSALALRFIENRIQKNIRRDRNLSYSVQRYNGLACIGCTERVRNSCISGMNMAITPVYGARVLDLMVNSLMNNAAVNGLVSGHARNSENRIKSIFCLSRGAGNHEITSDTYLEEQRRYLLSDDRRSACEVHFR